MEKDKCIIIGCKENAQSEDDSFNHFYCRNHEDEIVKVVKEAWDEQEKREGSKSD